MKYAVMVIKYVSLDVRKSHVSAQNAQRKKGRLVRYAVQNTIHTHHYVL